MQTPTNYNPGSFGTYPRAVQTALRQHQHSAEARPDLFYRITRGQGIDESRRIVANLLNIPVNECVFVKNATTGVATVLRNLVFQKGDTVVYFDTIYGAVEKNVHSIMESSPVTTRKVEYALPVSHEDLVKRFQDVVSHARGEGLNVKVAVFDTIVSMPGVRFPFEALVEVCREEGILSLVDGAHGIGHIPLDLGALRPDFFTSNLHKYVPSFFPSFLRLITMWEYSFGMLIWNQKKMAIRPPRLRSPPRPTPQPTSHPHHIPNLMGIHPPSLIRGDNPHHHAG